MQLLSSAATARKKRNERRKDREEIKETYSVSSETLVALNLEH